MTDARSPDIQDGFDAWHDDNWTKYAAGCTGDEHARGEAYDFAFAAYRAGVSDGRAGLSYHDGYVDGHAVGGAAERQRIIDGIKAHIDECPEGCTDLGWLMWDLLYYPGDVGA